ncbi:MAG TPA: hypothetical protein VGF75_03810 [Candidatus Saccharimonadales bacterium]|jgi:predicted RNase H-like HicB family nuclease
MSEAIYQSVVYKEGEYFVAQCLNVDVSSFGKTEREAIANLEEALELYLEDVSKNVTPSNVEHPTVHSLRLQHA